ncbi:hypothetical protein FNF28_02988 [Cafeteria roenbergensis]|uniref:Uncharacterized protein n=1 Tax=Cafeteria roenbergensis TaxID=33653 RepID=A0A5A8DNA1_CAFRO|nr:hypothetical protein FNF28_02988 [Cafeteria roenbergensis]
MFVSGPEIAAPSPVAALVLPVTFSAYASRGTAGRRRAFLQSTASLYCVVTVSAVGEVRVVSAAGAVLARHWVWGPPSGPARDDRLDVEVRLPTVTAAALGGEASPFLAVSGSDGSLVTLELTWRGVNALTRYAPHLASARGFRVTFASASTLRDTGSICEVPGQALLASGSSAGPLSADIVSLAFDAAEPRFLWAGTRGGDVLVFDTRAPASARGAARRAGSGVCRLVHRFALASLVDPENADEADAAADLATTSLGAAVVETTRGYAVVSALAGTFLFNATGIAAATPRLVTSFATPPAEIQALKAAARLQREAGPGRASAEVLPTLLSLANAGPRGTTDPVAAWVSARSCPSASGEECDAVVRTATLLLPQPVRPAGADVGWMRVPAIGIVVVVAVGFQIWSKGGGGPVLEFLRKLGRLLGLVSGTGGGRSGGPGDKYSAQSLSAEDKAAVADLLRRTQASMGGGGMGGGLGGGLRGAGRGGGTGMAAGFDAMARAAADGGGGRFDRRAAMEEIHLQAEADRLAGVPRGGAFGRRDDHDDMGRGWGADDTPIGEWLPDPDYD